MNMTTQHFSYCCTALLVFTVAIVEAALFEGDVCTIRNSVGTCKPASQCLLLRQAFEARKVRTSEIPTCTVTNREEVICCPNTDIFGLSEMQTPVRGDLPPTPTETPNERPSVRACKEIERGLPASVEIQITDGTPVDRGEFPHMAAIGFQSISATGSSYEFACGGTLISKRFVLTAAHCLVSRGRVAKVVRLGVTDYTDTANAVEAKIIKEHIHPSYTNSRKYDDIALLELESDISYSKFVYPTCLYSQLADPIDDYDLFVTGWGTINTTTREVSNTLLKAQLQVQSLDKCDVLYRQAGPTRHIDRGIIETQMCAYDPGYTKDACQGDSGGPLNLILENELRLNYRVIGIISAGFSCGTRTPGLYTRVASYLQFIEDIVWPAA